MTISCYDIEEVAVDGKPYFRACIRVRHGQTGEIAIHFQGPYFTTTLFARLFAEFLLRKAYEL